MKYLKSLYENIISTEPKIGDYVICTDIEDKPEFINFLNNNIGKIVMIKRNIPDNDKLTNVYVAKFDNIPENIKSFFKYRSINNTHYNLRGFYPHEIINFSENKNDLLTYLTANKYNL